ncbi:MAG: hypothetical protein GF383_12905 [Candidatus Lokiarchaeota archaeon]|nr:hypothetical protein [Candidatus Lokiarchaeota archaeon]
MQVFCFDTSELEGLFLPKQGLKSFNPLECTAYLIDEGLFQMKRIIANVNENYSLMIEKPHPVYIGALPWNTYQGIPAEVIFNFCGDLPKLGTKKTTIIFPFLDENNRDALPSDEDIFNFLKVAVFYTQKTSTFWHCHAGVNRSAFMLALYLYTYHFDNMSMEDVIEFIRGKHHDYCLSNETFVRKLKELEARVEF